MYHIISPDSNIMEPPILGDKLAVFVSESFDTLDEMMKMINKFYWFERYEHYDKFYGDKDFYDTEEETKIKNANKEEMQKFVNKNISGNYATREEYEEYFDELIGEDNSKIDYVKEPEYQFVHKFYKRDKEEYINNMVIELKSIGEGNNFFKVYDKIGMSIDSPPLVIAITKDIMFTFIDENNKSKHNYIKATKEQFDSMFPEWD
jgi:hypothetical protein